MQAIAATFAAVAVPVVVALAGWQIQTSISHEGVQKDYVQMAIGILSSAKSPEDKSLRQWAVTVLEKNSPVPFTRDIRANLESGVVVIQPKLFRPILATPMMAPPQPWVTPPKNYTLDELINNYAENMQRAQHNYLGLKYLQEAVRSGANAESGSAAPDSDSKQAPH